MRERSGVLRRPGALMPRLGLALGGCLILISAGCVRSKGSAVRERFLAVIEPTPQGERREPSLPAEPAARLSAVTERETHAGSAAAD